MPKFTQTLTMHMNGGSKFSQLNYDIFADGKPTGIKRYKRTDGSPRYLITDDVFKCGDDKFDNLAARGTGLMEWLESHIAPPGEPASETQPA